MELKRDLLKKEKKSIFRIVIGILFLLFSGIWIVDRIIDNETIRVFDWFYTGTFALNGIFHTIEGFGYSVVKFFGKAFVLINDDLISIKREIMVKEQTIYWKDIKSIDYKLNKFLLELNDDTILTIELTKFDYALKNEIKGIIDHIANNKNLKAGSLRVD